MVEQPAVNRRVVGSSPTCGASRSSSPVYRRYGSIPFSNNSARISTDPTTHPTRYTVGPGDNAGSPMMSLDRPMAGKRPPLSWGISLFTSHVRASLVIS